MKPPSHRPAGWSRNSSLSWMEPAAFDYCFRKNCLYTTFTNLSMKYLLMCKIYTDVGGIKQLYHVCPPVRKIIHSLKLVNYLHIQADNPWYNYYLKYYALLLQSRYVSLVALEVEAVSLSMMYEYNPKVLYRHFHTFLAKN